MMQQGNDASSIVEAATPLRRRNRLLALILAGVAMGVLVTALSVVLVIHDAEAGHVAVQD